MPHLHGDSDSVIRIGLAGLGKMGLSHLAILNTHPAVKVAAACDTSAYLTDALGKYTGLKCYPDLHAMLKAQALDAVVISTPSRLHAAMVEQALQQGLHVFCEKPFVLDPAAGERLVALADAKQQVTQVGYHLRFVGAFQEAARVLACGALGELHHVRAEAYGPVVLRPKGATWRATKSEGGGALYDYACHALDLMNFIAGTPQSIGGAALSSVFSRDVEDAVYCTLYYPGGATGQLAVNWSDESSRKMSTRISAWGSNGRLVADRQECQVYLREAGLPQSGMSPGWTVRYTTELTEEVWYYLRGEEYSAQIDYFVRSIQQGRTNGTNSFRSALEADRVAAMIDAQRGAHQSERPSRPRQARSRWARIFS
jgi:scyllo-inositol 2-dehydrogenase (NADP+)